MNASRWRTTPGNFARLMAGLWLFGTGDGFIVASALGNSPWTVLAEGVSLNTTLSVGTATIAVSGAVLLGWIPLRQAPGLGTVMNAIVIGLAIDVTLAVLGDPGLAVRTVWLLGGIALVAVGSGFYLGSALGPGPRDGLMTGLHRVTGAPIGVTRTAIEITALSAGWALGGTVGIGTLVFALTIGPAVGIAVRRMSPVPAHEM